MSDVAGGAAEAEPRLYTVVLADPGWQYESNGLRGCIVNDTGMAMYTTNSMAELAKLRIPAEKEAVLFCWLTMPLIHDQLVLVEDQWGFTYKGPHAIWHKCTLTDSSRSLWRPGSITAANVEILGMFTRGARFAALHGANLRFDAPAGVHSSKPPVVHRIVRNFCTFWGLGKPVELFARNTGAHDASEWDFTVGDQQDRFRDQLVMPHPGYAVVPAARQKRAKAAAQPQPAARVAAAARWVLDIPDAAERCACIVLDPVTVTLDWLLQEGMASLELDVSRALGEHGCVLARSGGRDFRPLIETMTQKVGLPFRTIAFFTTEFHPAFQAADGCGFWLMFCAKNAQPRRNKKAHISQVVRLEHGKVELVAVLEAARTVFGRGTVGVLARSARDDAVQLAVPGEYEAF